MMQEITATGRLLLPFGVRRSLLSYIHRKGINHRSRWNMDLSVEEGSPIIRAPIEWSINHDGVMSLPQQPLDPLHHIPPILPRLLHLRPICPEHVSVPGVDHK